MTARLKNWAGNYTYNAARMHRPTTVEQLQDIVRNSKQVKALGTRHSFNPIADTTEDLVSLEHFSNVVALDPERRTVTVGAGVQYGHLCEYLHRNGFALHNLASLPHISVAGACATATHGSGDQHGILATAVSAMELVTGSGEVIVLSHEQHGEQFRGVVVNLGGLGVVTKLTLDVLPTFDMRQDVYEDLSLAALEENLDTIFSSAYSVSLFTDWQCESINQVWLKRQVSDDSVFKPELEWLGAKLARNDLHPITGISAVNCTRQMGIRGAWYERMPHFRMDYTPSSGEELQSEYLVPRQHACAALRAISELREFIAPLLQISEVRSIAADDLWMSPCYEQGCIGIHFTWKKEWEAVKQLLLRIEEQLAPFEARPHWGKLFTMSPTQLRSLYRRLPDFQHLVQTFDPHGKFRNSFLETFVLETPL